MSPRKQVMKMSDVKAEGLKAWYGELQEYNHPDELKPLLRKLINKDKVEHLGDIQKLKDAMKLNNISIMGYTVEL